MEWEIAVGGDGVKYLKWNNGGDILKYFIIIYDNIRGGKRHSNKFNIF
jgi:hypothetical protein